MNFVFEPFSFYCFVCHLQVAVAGAAALDCRLHARVVAKAVGLRRRVVAEGRVVAELARQL